MIEKTIYIAGKVTGLKPEVVAVKFAAAQEMWEDIGFKVVNPITLINNPNEPWNSAMEKCLTALGTCDAIYMLPCSVDSPGAKLELQRAIELNLDIHYNK
jgi:hypothetical protein